MHNITKSYKHESGRRSVYWKNHPVMRFNERVNRETLISPKETLLERYVDNKLAKLPDGFHWYETDTVDNRLTGPIIDFIQKNDDSTFRQILDHHMILWKMGINGKFVSIVDDKQQICGTIGFNWGSIQLGEIDRLVCIPYYFVIDPSYRGSGMAKVLMDRVIANSFKFGIDAGCFATNRMVSAPIVQLRHYLRPLNYKYLVERKFIDIEDVDQEIAHNRTKIRLKPNPLYIRAESTEQNVRKVYELYERQRTNYYLSRKLSIDEIQNYFFDEKYCTTLLVHDDSNPTGDPIDFIAYHTYVVIGADQMEIRCADIIQYSTQKTREDILIINALKQISMDGIHIVNMTDQQNSDDVLLCTSHLANEDTDDEERTAVYDLNFIKSSKKTMINLFNLKGTLIRPNMVSWPII